VDDFRKAAILLQHLDPESRNRILAKLPESQQAQIVSLLNTPIEVDAAELTEIVREYQARFQTVSPAPIGDTAADPVESTTSDVPEDDLEPDSTASSIRSPFSPSQLAELLAFEPDAILSAIIAHLPRTAGRELFVRLEQTRQTSVTDCLADQEEIAPAVAEEINNYLAEKHRAFSKHTKKGLSVLSGLLTAGGTANEIIAGRLNERDRELLKTLRRDADSSERPGEPDSGLIVPFEPS
jgi:flagellar motor switch protein FliG